MRKLFVHYRLAVTGHRDNSTTVRDIYNSLTSHSSPDQWRVSSFIFKERFPYQINTEKLETLFFHSIQFT